MKKIISILISLITIVTAISAFPTAAMANSKGVERTFAMTISATQVNSSAKKEIDRLNSLRANNGLSPVSADANLENFAKNRAAQMLLGGSFNHSGNNYYEIFCDEKAEDPTRKMLSYFPGYGLNVFTASQKNYDKFKADVDDFAQASYADIKSVGIAVLKFKNVYSYYAIFSESPSTKAYSDFSDKGYKTTQNVLYRYIKSFEYKGKKYKNKYYNLYALGYFTGYCQRYIEIPNSQLVYKSTKPKIFKIKGYKGYVKGSGQYSIELYDKYKTMVCTFKKLNSSVDLGAPGFYVKSKKKSQITVRWQTFNDGSGYQIQYSTNKKMKGAKTIKVKGTKNKLKTIKKLKSKKKYYVRVRAYLDQGDGEKIYTKWSAKKSIKVK